MKNSIISSLRKCLSKKLFFALCFGYILTLVTIDIYAQSGEAGMTKATSEVKTYFKFGTNLMYAIGSVVGIVGAIKVYNKWNAGDQDTMKVASSWLGSCIFLIVVTAILKGFFNV